MIWAATIELLQVAISIVSCWFGLLDFTRLMPGRCALAGSLPGAHEELC